MGTFDDVMENARNAAQAAGKKIGETADITKLKLQAVSIRGDMKRIYESLGKDMYKMIKNGKLAKDGYEAETEKLDELSNQLSMTLKLIDKAKGSIKCPVCGQSCSHDSIYCKKCGSKLK